MSRLTIFGLTILLAFAPVALAVDGTVLINQSTITNGLTGCPTGGHFPIIICQSGSYRLSGNLTVPDGNTTGIQISADDVTLDLNGFSILGPVVCSVSGFPEQTTCSQNGSITTAGIFSVNSNITVSNGTIRGFGGFGVLLGALGSGVLVERVKAVSNASGGMDVEANSAIVTLCQSNFNGGNGFLGIGTISNSSAVNNNGAGFDWVGTVTGNMSNFNALEAFFGRGVFIANSGLSNGTGIVAGQVSVVISNALYSSGVVTAPTGSVVVNNTAQ